MPADIDMHYYTADVCMFNVHTSMTMLHIHVLQQRSFSRKHCYTLLIFNGILSIRKHTGQKSVT